MASLASSTTNNNLTSVEQGMLNTLRENSKKKPRSGVEEILYPAMEDYKCDYIIG